MKKGGEVILQSIEPKSHPRHYLIHKYWSRKPHNVINYLILKHTKEKDSVLDPYMGSGVVILESLKLNRKVIGIDLNPISYFLINTIIKKINLKKLTEEQNKIIKSIDAVNKNYYSTLCPNCKKKAIIDTSLVEELVKCKFCLEDTILIKTKRVGTKYFCLKCGSPLKRKNKYIAYNYKKLKGYCNNCGFFIKDYNKKDIELVKKINKQFKHFLNNKNMWVPKEKIKDSIKRSGKEKLYELFSERNLIVINYLLKKINSINNKNIRNFLLLTLTASLPNMSKMIPADEKNIRGKSGWQIPKYYIFPSHIEKNVLLAYKKRFDSNLVGLKEINNMNIKSQNARLFNVSSKDINFIDDNSIDYILTDPPYGNTIQYLSLSALWNSLLKFKTNLEEEIIWDKNRNKTLENYYKDLLLVFKECNRVLKDNKYMSLTFNARDFKLLKILINSCLNAGFNLKEVNHQKFAVSSATQGLNWKNTLKGDFIFTFKKEKKLEKNIYKHKKDIKLSIINEIIKILKPNKFLEFGDLYAMLIPKIIERGLFNDERIDLINIDNILENNFKKKIINSRLLWCV